MTEQTHYADWEKLTPLPREKRPDEKVGRKFVVVDDHPYFEQGEIVELVKNDCTAIPYFKSIKASTKLACYWSNLAPLPEQSKIKQENAANNKTKYRFTPKVYANGEMDFYRIVDSLPVRPAPEIEHALKKQLFTGQRGHKSELQDLKEAKLSIEMRISYLEGVKKS